MRDEVVASSLGRVDEDGAVLPLARGSFALGHLYGYLGSEQGEVSQALSTDCRQSTRRPLQHSPQVRAVMNEQCLCRCLELYL